MIVLDPASRRTHHLANPVTQPPRPQRSRPADALHQGDLARGCVMRQPQVRAFLRAITRRHHRWHQATRPGLGGPSPARGQVASCGTRCRTHPGPRAENRDLRAQAVHLVEVHRGVLAQVIQRQATERREWVDRRGQDAPGPGQQRPPGLGQGDAPDHPARIGKTPRHPPVCGPAVTDWAGPRVNAGRPWSPPASVAIESQPRVTFGPLGPII